MQNKKGQAALEFLMTYGWAILVVLVVIGALAYFGVLSPQTILPEKCVLTTGLNCEDYTITSTNFTFRLQNALGQQINVTKVSLTQKAVTGATPCNGTTATTINNGEAGVVSASAACSFTETGTKEKFDVLVTYYNTDTGSAFPHDVTGEVLAEIQ